MKKALIVVLVLVLPATLWAMDINQGKFEISGQTMFEFSDLSTEVSGEPDIDTTSYEFRLDGLYYIQKNLGVGVIFEYDKTEIEQGVEETDISSFLFGPQVTYNIPLNEKFSVFVNGAVGYATAEIEDNDADGFGFQFGGGLKYFVTNFASINGALKYQSLDLEDDFDRDFEQSGISLGAGLSIYF